MKTRNKYLHIDSFLRKNVILVALIVCIVIFQILTKGILLSPRNLSNLLRQTSIIGVVTMSMLMLIIAGNIDLACGMSAAIIIISSELEEIYGICDRIIVMSEGQITAKYDDTNVCREEIMKKLI